jgi:sec-independent protein translocase protein TatA
MPIGAPEVIIVLVIALIILGPKKLPQLGRSLGSGMREFKDSIGGGSKHDDDDDAAEITAPDDKPADKPASSADKTAASADKPASSADKTAASADKTAASADKPAGDPAATAPRDAK